MLGFGSESSGNAAMEWSKSTVRAKRATVRRALLFDGSEPEPWQRELLSLFVRNQLKTTLALPILALILTVVGLRWVDPVTSVLWFVSVIACQALQHSLCLRYERREYPSIAPVE